MKFPRKRENAATQNFVGRIGQDHVKPEAQTAGVRKKERRVAAEKALSAGAGMAAGFFLFVGAIKPALAKTIVSCGGAALLGGAQLLCSHLDPHEPPQLCTFSWALATPTNQTQVVQGSFLLPPGASNVEVYQAGGFAHAMSGPIVLCQGKRRPR
jgi:hypothetical protein